MFFGSRLNRLATSIRRGISKYSVGSDNPGLVFDFIDNFYQKDKNQTVNFNGAITHARSGNAVMTDGYGPELVVNGGFDSDSDWTKGTGWSIADGKAVSVGHTGHSLITQPYSFISGKTYEVTYTITNYGSGTFAVQFTGSGTTTGTNRSANGTYTEILTVVANHTAFGIRSNDGNGIGSIDNVSVREMPVLKWAPHNLYQYSEQFDNSYWQKTLVTVSANSTVAPNGTTTADKLIPTVVNTSHYIGNAISYPVASETYELCVYAKPAGYNFIKLFGANSSTSEAWFDISNGTKGTTGGTGFVSSSITDVGNGWYRCALKFINPDATARNTGYYVINADNVKSFAGDGTSGIHVWGAHLYKADLGGMVDNPDRGDSYVPTAVRAFGPNLITNGSFETNINNWDNISGGVASYQSGVMRITPAPGDNLGGAEQAITTEANKAYELTVTVPNVNGATFRFGAGTATNFTNKANRSSLGAGTHTISFVAGGSTTYIILYAESGGVNTYVDVDNVVVRESSVRPDTARYLPRIGHHVYNGSAWVNEGLLAESEARVNVQENSNVFTGAGNATITADQAVSPDGTTNASLYDENAAANSNAGFFGIATVTAGVAYTNSVFVKYKSGSGWVVLCHRGSSASNQFFAWFDIQNGVVGSNQGGSGTMLYVDHGIENCGNGWYRIYTVGTDSGSTTYNTFIISAPSDNNSNRETDAEFYVYGAQLEAGSTPSSLIPTSGSSVTRAAETFTIPSANLPWPEPNYIGSELVTNGTFDSDLSGWTAGASWTWSDGKARDNTTASSPSSDLSQTISVTSGKVYAIRFDISGLSGGTPTAFWGGSTLVSVTANGSYEEYVVATASSHDFLIKGSQALYYVDNVSIREIDPLSVSIAMDGRMTYADTGAGGSTGGRQGEAVFYTQFNDASNYLEAFLSTASTAVGEVQFAQESSGTRDTVATAPFSPDILVPFNIASRHGSTFINGAVDGVALTANTTPTALSDLSATDLSLAYDYMGTLATFRVWDRDIGDTGLVEATSPSLEPSLSLTFEGVGTNSFVVNDWS